MASVLVRASRGVITGLLGRDARRRLLFGNARQVSGSVPYPAGRLRCGASNLSPFQPSGVGVRPGAIGACAAHEKEASLSSPSGAPIAWSTGAADVLAFAGDGCPNRSPFSWSAFAGTRARPASNLLL